MYNKSIGGQNRILHNKMNRGEDETAVAVDGGVAVELPLGTAAPDFSLAKAVCSHGFFMMAPNQWDPHSKTLTRPLRLGPDDDVASFMVCVSQPPRSVHALHLRVFGTRSLSSQQQQSLLGQVRRMLRLSEEENKRVTEFHKVHEEAKERGFGRMFRAPTLFEDIIKCMLLCNCQWSRTLSMAQALCELQAELQHPLSSASNGIAENGTISSSEKTEVKNFAPKTPAGKESKRKNGVRKCSKTLANKYAEALAVEETEMKISSGEAIECSQETMKLSSPTLQSRDVNESLFENCDPLLTSAHVSYHQPLEGTEGCTVIGNFPSARELARLDETFLAKRCNLGYRARRVINFAREVVEGRIQLLELEDACAEVSLSEYEKMTDKLRMIDGFGPFTCANVLMCMGYYHVVPSDSETIRHLKQVHAKRSTMQTVETDIADIYGKYAPFQFLAYWSEIWHFYEEWFGKLSEVPHSSYKLITAANMRPKTKRGSKRKKLSVEEVH